MTILAPDLVPGVLVADLDAERLAMTVDLLRAAHYRVYPASDGIALRALLHISPAPLIAVVALHDGLALTRALLALFVPTPTDATHATEPAKLATGEPGQQVAAAEPEAEAWVLRHAFILQAEPAQSRLVALTLVRLGQAFARSAPPLRTAHDAVALLTLLDEAAQTLAGEDEGGGV